MWRQFTAIAWAQFRSTRNRMGRSTVGGIVTGGLLVVWYVAFAVAGCFAGFLFSSLRIADLRHVLPMVLFGALLFWQWIPLLTMTAGWSLQLSKLQSYPIANGTFFWIETGLRLSSAPELVLLLLGLSAGLVCNPAIPALVGLTLLLYVPFNLFLALAIRETLLTYSRGRFRELFAILFVALAVLPQALLRTQLGERLRPHFAAAVQLRWSPWRAFADLADGSPWWPRSLSVALIWTVAAWFVARRQFARSLRTEETPRAEVRSAQSGSRRGAADVAAAIARLFRDPTAALIEKEIRSLLRMPRFRVIFGMACVFSLLVFFPLGFGTGGTSWIRENFLPVVNLYGLLLLGDTLLWNVFGFDRAAAQFWFLSSAGLRTAFHAKNLTAALFIALQNLVVLAAATLLRFPVTLFNVECAVLASVVVSTYFLAIGNISSVAVPRAVDPSQTLRKQAGGRVQIWLLGSALAMTALVGFAFLARWAVGHDWALLAIFGVELAIGVIVYRIAMESAVARGMRDRERILDALSKSAAPVSM